MNADLHDELFNALLSDKYAFDISDEETRNELNDILIHFDYKWYNKTVGFSDQSLSRILNSYPSLICFCGDEMDIALRIECVDRTIIDTKTFFDMLKNKYK